MYIYFTKLTKSEAYIRPSTSEGMQTKFNIQNTFMGFEDI